MLGSINRVTLCGSLDRDPEVRDIHGSRVASLVVLAPSVQQPEESNDTECHYVTVHGDDLIDLIERDLRKGSKILIEGQLQSRTYTDVHGCEFHSAEILVWKGTGDVITFTGR
jgi:single-strand DNA-binding protein